MASWGVESKLRSFIKFAIDKLDASAESLQDEDPEDNYQELCTFTGGMCRHLRSTGAGASGELKHALAEGLSSVWNLKTDEPGEELTVDALKAAMEALLAGPLADEAESIFEVDETTKPENLGDMSFQDAASYMWDVLDKENRVNWGDDGFTLDLQNKGRYGQDKCEATLFTWVNEENTFWGSAVTKSFVDLLDNYERETGKAEVVTKEEKQEMATFLDALTSTNVMKFAFEYLKLHGQDPRCKKLSSIPDFQSLLFDLWLAPYRRFKANDSSGFEHVFVGEEKKGKIIGLHNWVQFYFEEKKGNIDYLGWVGKQDADYSDDVNIVTVKFAWDDDDAGSEEKPMSTMLCGSTIEFEMAILTMAFLGNGEGDTPFTLGSENLNIKCYAQKVRYGGTKIATAYIELGR